MSTDRDARITMVVVALLFGILSCSFALKISIEEWPTFDQVIKGKALLPFQHRVLAPWMIEGIHRAIGGQESLPLSAAIFYALTLTVLFYCYYWFLRRYFDHLFSLLAAVLLLLSILIGWLVFVNINDLPLHGARYPFDVTGVLFFVLLAHAAVKDRLGLWYFLLAIATLNRETIVVLVPFLGLLLWTRRGFKRAVPPVLISLLIFGAVKGLLIYLYPGRPVDWKLFQNFYSFGELYGSETLLSLVFLYGGLWLFAPLGFRALPRDIRLMFVSLPFALVGLFLFGVVHETRIYDEYAVFVIPAGLLGINRLVRNGS